MLFIHSIKKALYGSGKIQKFKIYKSVKNQLQQEHQGTSHMWFTNHFKRIEKKNCTRPKIRKILTAFIAKKLYLQAI